jgi:toxin CcdB
MAQFDVHRNVGRLRETVPFVVVVQSSQFDSYRRRVVVPLVRSSTLRAPPLRALNPAFTIRNLRVVLHPLDLVSMPVEQLGEHVGSLAESADVIVAALDEVLTRAWR